MKHTKNLKFDPSLKIDQLYKGDPRGAFVLNAPQLEMVLLKSSKPDEILAEIWFGAESAGPPGHVHGGCQAAVLDEIMGSTGWYHGYSVVAAKIEVEFLEMVPVKKQYSVRGRIVSIENRKVYVEAEIFDAQQTYAKSTGLFIQLTPEQAQALAEKMK